MRKDFMIQRLDTILRIQDREEWMLLDCDLSLKDSLHNNERTTTYELQLDKSRRKLNENIDMGIYVDTYLE